MSTFKAPEDNVSYPLVIGESLKGNSSPNLYCIQYHFLKQSIDFEQPGKLIQDSKEGDLTPIKVVFYNKKQEVASVLKGSFKEQNSITECVLLFDGERFVIERVALSASGLRESDEDKEKQKHAKMPKKRPRSSIAKINEEDLHNQNKRTKQTTNGGTGLAAKCPRVNVTQTFVKEETPESNSNLNSSFDDSDSDSESTSSSE